MAVGQNSSTPQTVHDPGVGSAGHFAPDDYENVNDKYFSDILRNRTWEALPAGWHNPHSVAAGLFKSKAIEHADLQRYSLDEGHALGELKSAILSLFGAWESKPITGDELTLCPSVSTANLAALCALKSRGYGTVILETPSYFATLEQAALLNLHCIRVPSYLSGDFEIGPEIFSAFIGRDRPCALWITQPRFGTGQNRDLEWIRRLASALGPSNVLVIDEAAEQYFPSKLSEVGAVPCPVIRTRGILKGIGLNGLRVSAILHPKDWRGTFERVLEPAGASLDRYSLINAASIAESPHLFSSLLSAANTQVTRSRKRIEMLALDSWIRPTPIENGYIGTLILDFSRLRGAYRSKRTALLEYCRDQRLPVVLRASIGFAFDESWEGVRLNYFTPESNIDCSGRLLRDAFEKIIDYLQVGPS